MRRTCYTCYYHKDEDGYIECGFNGHCIYENNYKPFRGSVEEMQMALDPWRKSMAKYEAELLNRNSDTTINVRRSDGKNIGSKVISTDNPNPYSWLKAFSQEK